MFLFFLLVVALGIAAESWSIRHALDGIRFDLRLTRSLVEPGEKFDIISSVANTSRRFIPYLKVSELVPTDLQTASRKYDLGLSNGISKVNSSLYLMPRQKNSQRVTGSLPDRGRYTFTGATLFGGDFLGVSVKAKYFSLLREAVVLPRRIESPELDRTLGGYLGDRSVDRFILEDPVLTVGFREYTGREPMKQISWAATARTGQMMVRNYDHTLELTVTVVLNIDTQLYGAYAYPLMEDCYRLARAVCEELESKHITYSFCTNANAVNQLGPWYYVSDGLGGAHLSTILEGLGRATYDRMASSDRLMEGVFRRAESGRAHIIITPLAEDFRPGLISALEEQTGAKVLMLTAKEAKEA